MMSIPRSQAVAGTTLRRAVAGPCTPALSPRGRRALCVRAFRDEEVDSSARVRAAVQRLQERWQQVQHKKTALTLTAGVVVGTWVGSSVLSTLDRLPLLPDLLTFIGLVYSANFFWRYVLFRDGRDELRASWADLYESLRDTVEGVTSSSATGTAVPDIIGPHVPPLTNTHQGDTSISISSSSSGGLPEPAAGLTSRRFEGAPSVDMRAARHQQPTNPVEPAATGGRAPRPQAAPGRPGQANLSQGSVGYGVADRSLSE